MAQRPEKIQLEMNPETKRLLKNLTAALNKVARGMASNLAMYRPQETPGQQPATTRRLTEPAQDAADTDNHSHLASQTVPWDEEKDA